MACWTHEHQVSQFSAATNKLPRLAISRGTSKTNEAFYRSRSSHPDWALFFQLSHSWGWYIWPRLQVCLNLLCTGRQAWKVCYIQGWLYMHICSVLCCSNSIPLYKAPHHCILRHHTLFDILYMEQLIIKNSMKIHQACKSNRGIEKLENPVHKTNEIYTY